MKFEIRSLRLVDCGPFRDTLIDFTDPSTGKARPVTLLGGANGSGKTTVLEMVYAAAKTLKISNGTQFPKKVEYLRMDFLVGNEVSAAILGDHPNDEKLPEPRLVISTTTTRGFLVPEATARNSALAKLASLLHNFENTILDFPDHNKLDAFGDNPRPPTILYFPYHRFIHPVRGAGVHTEEIRYRWTYRYDNTLSSFGGSFDSYLVWLDYAEPEVFKRVCDFLNELDFDGKTFSIHRKSLKVIVTTRSGQTHHLEDLSSGEQNILIMLLELRRRMLPHSVVLIDEIENSLHPAFQYRLAQSLLKLQEMVPFQLIATTHAPAFVEIFGAESTLILTEF